MSWHAKNTGAYALGSAEANDNAVMIYYVLRSLGFDYNAICAVLGNIGYESGYNPWRWQSDYVLATTDTYYINNQTAHAYGLLQFDPAGGINYINNNVAMGFSTYGPHFSNHPGNVQDGDAQLRWMDAYAIPVNVAYIPTAAYPLTYSQFKTSTNTVSYLTYAWEYNYERGTWSNDRLTHSAYWETNLINLIPTGIPVWMLFKIKEGGTHNA